MYFLGVDGGGTKTAFTLSDDNGCINGRFSLGGSNFIRKGKAEVSKLLHKGVNAVCTIAGIDKSDIHYAVFGFSGYGETSTSAVELDVICRDVFNSEAVYCTNDSEIAWAGSLALNPGINIIAGTGSTCFGKDRHGNNARTSGWGAYCDEGSCQWIGNKAIGIFTKQADGRLPKTPLYPLFREYFQLEEDLFFCHTLNRELVGRSSSLAKLQLLVETAYDQDDPYAIEIYNKAADELWLAIETTAKKLRFDGQKYRVSYSGGLFKSGKKILGPLGKKAENHQVILMEPRFAPDLGAILLAMKQSGFLTDFSSFSFYEKTNAR